MLILLLFLLFIFLIGFFFARLAYIPQIRKFLLRNPKSKIGGLFLLAIFPFLSSLIFYSRLAAVTLFEYLVSISYNPNEPNSGAWNWLIQNESSILNKLWIRILFPFLSGETCPLDLDLFDPDLCKYVVLEGPRDYELLFIPALISAFITLILGWLFTRKKPHTDS